jgi:hypothetical protein
MNVGSTLPFLKRSQDFTRKQQIPPAQDRAVSSRYHLRVIPQQGIQLTDIVFLANRYRFHTHVRQCIDEGILFRSPVCKEMLVSVVTN